MRSEKKALELKAQGWRERENSSRFKDPNQFCISRSVGSGIVREYVSVRNKKKEGNTRQDRTLCTGISTFSIEMGKIRCVIRVCKRYGKKS